MFTFALLIGTVCILLAFVLTLNDYITPAQRLVTTYGWSVFRAKNRFDIVYTDNIMPAMLAESAKYLIDLQTAYMPIGQQHLAFEININRSGHIIFKLGPAWIYRIKQQQVIDRLHVEIQPIPPWTDRAVALWDVNYGWAIGNAWIFVFGCLTLILHKFIDPTGMAYLLARECKARSERSRLLTTEARPRSIMKQDLIE